MGRSRPPVPRELRPPPNSDGRLHQDIPRPNYTRYADDWYGCDPGSDAASEPLWYAPDVIRQLLAAQPPQEIGSHSFSHLIFGESGCTPEAAAGDIAACVAAARDWRLQLVSFVYPRNRVGFLSTLEEHGFRCYRGPDPAWFTRLPGPLKRVGHYADDLFGLTPPLITPTRAGSLWNIPGSMMLQSMDGPRRLIPASARSRRCIAGLRAAAARREVFHLWFHPVNFCAAIEPMMAILKTVLVEAARLRDAGAIEVLTMARLAARMDATEEDPLAAGPAR